jgi:hypothetical protein
MTRKNTLKVLFALSVAALAACGGGGGEQAPAAADSPPPSSAPSPAPSPSATASATLAWSGPADARVQGYRVYYGTTSRSYLQGQGAGLDAGSSTQLVVNSLQSGSTYYFAVTSYDSTGNESDYSNEVTKVVN